MDAHGFANGTIAHSTEPFINTVVMQTMESSCLDVSYDRFIAYVRVVITQRLYTNNSAVNICETGDACARIHALINTKFMELPKNVSFPTSMLITSDDSIL